VQFSLLDRPERDHPMTVQEKQAYGHTDIYTSARARALPAGRGCTVVYARPGENFYMTEQCSCYFFLKKRISRAGLGSIIF